MPREDLRNGSESSGLRPLQRQRIRRLLMLGGGLALLAFLLLDRGIIRHGVLRQRIDSLQTARALAQEGIAFYKELNKGLETGDSLALEAEARRLGMIRPGEHVQWIELPEDTLGEEH